MGIFVRVEKKAWVGGEKCACLDGYVRGDMGIYEYDTM